MTDTELMNRFTLDPHKNLYVGSDEAWLTAYDEEKKEYVSEWSITHEKTIGGWVPIRFTDSKQAYAYLRKHYN